MAFTIEDYTVEELIKLGEQVQVVGRVSISGDAKAVGQTFMALGMFAQLACELKGLTSDNACADDGVEDSGEKPAIIYEVRENGFNVLNRSAPLPDLTFLRCSVGLPCEEPYNKVERRYLVRFKPNNDDYQYRLAYFGKGQFWFDGSDNLDPITQTMLRESGEWSPLV